MFSERREQAIRWMLRAHEGQVRKAEPEVPYIAHLIHVAFIVQEAGGGEDSVIAALLHDALEDTDVTPEELEGAFGPRVTAIVREVSEDKTLRWADRKARMIEQLRKASPEACLVAAADKIHNLETLTHAHRSSGPAIWESFRGAPEPTLRFYAGTLEALRGRIPEILEGNLERALETARRLILG
ncbi:MAG: bifunctional (p)ppGpp synthetase/guanosine-3',5'-bis(diphosphate) 3'-pyrophosphohydrolase [Candidatus Eisenbacteria bacterium]|nr:bifunctional (p)ppGpp synthetase/guanosine-3',5'-bis(diphosphate) 3'-pyrophosphohydrolase [Candidatus Eisenbacteria bacterium]